MKNKKTIIFSILTLAIITFLSIYIYNTYCLIYYVEDYASNAMEIVTFSNVNIKVYNNGSIEHNSNKEMLDKKELTELKELIKQLKAELKNTPETPSATKRFTINRKTYDVNTLTEKGQNIFSKIRNIIY